MNKKGAVLKWVISLIIFILLIGISYALYKSLKDQTIDKNQILCDEVGGVWRQFSDGCVDTCFGKQNGIVCTQVLAFGCDCSGEDMCWDGKNCIDENAYLEEISDDRRY